ncbi:hypothetical protein [Nonomuraea cavernae]|uniref:Uncharacterized protein n=1 Tax=Nonomuraea cavernae TaxID=2045107 RepID=A0A918DKD3_9ACTN|nr:hypothetical protein [Nonomuraea cavernae]MCA2187822.1 hypothetical protein [Nonomuraea cavernae]GGO71956.1 hypothetical protein GCM10012289_38880 [Nonomuraea cavernae]
MRMMKFFWSAAVALSLWELLAEPLFAETVMVTCSSAGPLEWPQPVPAAQVAGFLGDWLGRLQPVLLALTAFWAIRSRPRGGPYAGRGGFPLPATLGLALALLPAALVEAEDRLSADMPFMWQECLNAQMTTPSFVVPRLILAWLLSPTTMVLLAGIVGAGIRPRLTELRATVLAVAAAVLAVFLPAALIGLPVNADGTPRYAVAGAGRPYVLDLETGEPVSLLPQATRTYFQYDLVVRDTEPGRYVAALTSLSGRHFRLYRLSMGDDGRITVGERLTPTLEGTVNGLAVSTEGRIAYGRITDDARFAGTLEREWPVSGYRLQWLDTRVLALPEHSVPAGVLATLDVGTGAIGEVAAPPEHEFTRPILPLPGGRQLRALGWPTRTLVLHEGTRLVRKVLTVDCGHIESLALDPTGRHALVGVDREAAEMDRSPLAGLPPCGGARSQLLRLDLETGRTRVVPGEQDPLVQAW